MSCYRPLPAYRAPDGGVHIGVAPADCYSLELPCNKCIGCKLDRARSWSIRIMHEAQLYDSNLFVTLTYENSRVGKGSWRADWRVLSLELRDLQLFMKRLRRRVKGVSQVVDTDGRKSWPIRFFAAGEYGSRSKRAHWHAILFNARFPDQRRLMNGTWRSALCEELWGQGNVVIGDVSGASAAYVAGYTLKKVHGQGAAEHYEDVVDLSTGELMSRRPEFVVMSRRPGIGSRWFDRYSSDVFPGDRAVQEGKCYKVPRYYWKRYEAEGDPFVVEDVAWRRELKAREHIEDSTPERRLVREVVAERRAALFSNRDL